MFCDRYMKLVSTAREIVAENLIGLCKSEQLLLEHIKPTDNVFSLNRNLNWARLTRYLTDFYSISVLITH